MNMFGLISLLLALACIVWFFGGQIEALERDNSSEGTYQNTLDAAHTAADQLAK